MQCRGFPLHILKQVHSLLIFFFGLQHNGCILMPCNSKLLNNNHYISVSGSNVDAMTFLRSLPQVLQLISMLYVLPPSIISLTQIWSRHTSWCLRYIDTTNTVVIFDHLYCPIIYTLIQTSMSTVFLEEKRFQ